MTGHEYYLMLNDTEQRQFIDNFRNCRLTEDNLDGYLEDEYEDFHTFISCSFLFTNTPEGVDYWREVRDSQRDGVDSSHKLKGKPKSIEGLMEALLFIALDDYVENKSEESLEDVLSELKIKLSDES
jgi:hypothetical protein